MEREHEPAAAIRVGDDDEASVLVADDDPAAARAAAAALEAEGLEVEWQPDASGARRVLAVRKFAAVVLALSLPDDGLELCREIRAHDPVPIVAVARGYSDDECVRALRDGADDYLSTPFSDAVLRARVRALLRRRDLDRAAVPGATKQVGTLTIDAARHGVVVDGAFVQLTRSEFEVLAFLADPPRVARTRAAIMAHLWRSDHVGDARACDVHVLNLRRKLERDPRSPQRLITVRSYGYRLEPA